jgi:hypothetical protein
MNSPLRADRDAKIKKLSTLLGKKPQKKVFVFSKIIKYVIFLILMLSAYVIYQEKETFRSFLLTKAQKISQRVSKKVTMTDVKYTVGSGNITVSGDITNEDQIIAKVDGVKIIIFDGESKITAWEVQLDEKTLLPEQKVHFSTIKPLPTEIREMRVEVSVF